MSGPFVTWNPAVRSGEPCLNGTRLPLWCITGMVWAGEPVDVTAEDYDVTVPDVLVACWWMGTHGSKKWRKRWGAWAEAVHGELWHSRHDVPPPPCRDGAAPPSNSSPVGADGTVG